VGLYRNLKKVVYGLQHKVNVGKEKISSDYVQETGFGWTSIHKNVTAC
jgi:hypothetical protein